MIQPLLDNGAWLEERDKQSSTLLFLAAQEGHLQAAEFLLDRGADLEAWNHKVQTPLSVKPSDLERIHCQAPVAPRGPAYLGGHQSPEFGVADV